MSTTIFGHQPDGRLRNGSYKHRHSVQSLLGVFEQKATEETEKYCYLTEKTKKAGPVFLCCLRSLLLEVYLWNRRSELPASFVGYFGFMSSNPFELR
jgi:hypothetical protein